MNMRQNMSTEDMAWIKREWKLLEDVKRRCNEHGGFEEQPQPLADNIDAKQ